MTATKRSEALIDVPAAVTSLNADKLIAAGFTSFKDFAALVPGLQINNNLGGGVPVIRGLTQGADIGGPTTGIVVDGAPFGISSAYSNGAQDSLDLDPIDLERVEVLRGPQGTIFGANTLGGLISYTLRKPSLDGLEGSARAEISDTKFGEMGGSIRASVSGALAPGRAGLRVSGYWDRQGGYIDNDLTGESNVNSSKRYGVSASLLLKPSDRLTILAAAFQQHVNIDGRDVVAYNVGLDPAPRNG
ncbi:MAG: TonB-dependent receptor plug domain-containing protein, partial [Rhodospirillaceae bacterium]|nr:TonB-dependent receptor plug domain-containing protein [Rhodospirillaceae bacterium]